MNRSAPRPNAELLAVRLDSLNAAAHLQVTAEPPIVRYEAPPETMHPATMPGQTRATDRDAERGVDARRAVHAAVHGVLDQHPQKGAQWHVIAETVTAQGVAEGLVDIPGQGQPPKPDRPHVDGHIGRAPHRQPHTRPARGPERVRQHVEQRPERAMSLSTTERVESFAMPARLITVER